MNCNVLLFDDFETLDAFGPAEIIGRKPDVYGLGYYSLSGGVIKSAQNVPVLTSPLTEITGGGVLLVPGGIGTRQLVNNRDFIGTLHRLANEAEYVLTVCTGAALLARTGLLDSKNATTNKLAFDWAASQGEHVCWHKRARWVVDGKYYTSSGVSAGMDMALGFIADTLGKPVADKIAHEIEYIWNNDKDNDHFAI